MHRVSLVELVRVYRTSPNSHRYDGQTIQVFVAAGLWVHQRDCVEAHRVFDDRPGCVQFRTEIPAPDPEAHLTVTGVCRGVIVDGRQRGGGVDWYVLVEDCKVTTVKTE